MNKKVVRWIMEELQQNNENVNSILDQFEGASPEYTDELLVALANEQNRSSEQIAHYVGMNDMYNLYLRQKAEKERYGNNNQVHSTRGQQDVRTRVPRHMFSGSSRR